MDKLLLIDDEPDIVRVLSMSLKVDGYDVKTATSGPEGLAAYSEEMPEIVITDIKMPGMDGSQVLRELKEKHRFLEAVILTGHGSLDSAVELTKLGAFNYLPKPYELEKLIEVLQSAYEHRLKAKFAADDRKLQEIMRISTSESPLGILRRLQQLDDEER